MSSFAVHTVHYTAIIKGTARVALPVGKRPEDYEHLLANHEINWNLHTICDLPHDVGGAEWTVRPPLDRVAARRRQQRTGAGLARRAGRRTVLR